MDRRRRVEQRLPAAEEEEDGVQQRQRGVPGEEGRRQGGDERRPRAGHRDHHAPPIEAVGQGTGQEREEEPRQALGEGEPGDRRRIGGQRGGEERRGDERHPIAEIGRGGRQPEGAEAPALRAGETMHRCHRTALSPMRPGRNKGRAPQWRAARRGRALVGAPVVPDRQGCDAKRRPRSREPHPVTHRQGRTIRSSLPSRARSSPTHRPHLSFCPMASRAG